MALVGPVAVDLSSPFDGVAAAVAVVVDKDCKLVKLLVLVAE